MDRNNPLLVLGVSYLALESAHETRDMSGVLTLAEASYRNLSRIYHPDMQSSSVLTQTEISQAIEVVRDPDGLEYYLDELFDRTSREKLHHRKAVEHEYMRKSTQADVLYEAFEWIDQTALLDITEPTTYLLAEVNRHILNIGPHAESGSYYVSRTWNSGMQPESGNFEYVNDEWREEILENDQVEHVIHDDLVYHGPVRVVGFVRSNDEVSYTQNHPSAPMFSVTIGEDDKPESWLHFENPEHCWFIGLIRFKKPVKGTYRLVVWRNGALALTPPVVARSIL